MVFVLVLLVSLHFLDSFRYVWRGGDVIACMCAGVLINELLNSHSEGFGTILNMQTHTERITSPSKRNEKGNYSPIINSNH